MTAPTSAIVQKRNAEMTALSSADLLAADDKNVATEIYSLSGGTAFSLDSNTLIPLDTQLFTSFPEVFTLDAANSKLTILEYGLYHFYASVGAQHNGGSSAATLQFWIEEEISPGTWFVLPMSQTFFTMAGVVNAKTSGRAVFTRFSEPGFSYRMKVQQAYGSNPFLTLAEQCRLGCIRLFKQG
jgi:hypothetical protein